MATTPSSTLALPTQTALPEETELPRTTSPMTIPWIIEAGTQKPAIPMICSLDRPLSPQTNWVNISVISACMASTRPSRVSNWVGVPARKWELRKYNIFSPPNKQWLTNHKKLDLKDFDRPAYRRNQLAADRDLSAQLHSPSSHGRSASLSDFGDLKRSFSPIEKFKKGALRDLPSDLDKELKPSSTPRVRMGHPQRPRSTFAERYANPSPPFRRPGNPVAKTMEREQAHKPAASTLPRSFKTADKLLEDLRLADAAALNPKSRETPTRNRSFRIPDMTGIQSLINTTPKATGGLSQAPKHLPIHSIPTPKEEEGSPLCKSCT